MSDEQREHNPEVDDQPVIDHEAILSHIDNGEEDAGSAPRSIHAGVRGIKALYYIVPVAFLLGVIALALVLHKHGSSTTATTSGTNQTQQLANIANPLDQHTQSSPLGPGVTPSATPGLNGCLPGYDARMVSGTKVCVLHGHPTPNLVPPNSAPTATPNPCPPNYQPQLVGGQMACVPVTNPPHPAANANPPANGSSGYATPVPTPTPLPGMVLALTDDQQTKADVAAQTSPTPDPTPTVNQNGSQNSYQNAYAYTPQGRTGFVSQNTQSSAQQYGAMNGGSQNDQFLSSAQQQAGYRPQLTPDQVGIGTVISYELETCINSDLPGTFLARTIAPVMDTATHRYVVIPSGTVLTGPYNGHLVPDQNGVLGAITGLRFPDGTEFDLPGEVVANAEGESGFYGDVNRHVGQMYTSAFLLTALGAISAALSPQTSLNPFGVPSIGQQISSAAGGQLSNLGTQMIQRSFGRPPTIVVCPPYQGTITVMHDLPLNRYRVGGNTLDQAVEYRVAPIGNVGRQFIAPLSQSANAPRYYYPIVKPTTVPKPTPAPSPTPRGGALDIPAYPSPGPRR